MLHLEGMGLMGSLTAHLLDSFDVPFTWHDTEADVCAWRACTGISFPSGEPGDTAYTKQWLGCIDIGHGQLSTLPEPGERFAHAVAPFMERAVWCHYSKHAPHRGHNKIALKGQAGGVRVSDHFTASINAQDFVEATRRQFASTRQQVSMPPERVYRTVDLDTTEHEVNRYLVTHGFAEETIGKWSWGWMCKVQLELSTELEQLCYPYRPTLYMRDGFTLDYAYPVPREPGWWYAGTTLVTQDRPRRSDNPLVFANWMERMRLKAAGAFKVVNHQHMVQGWRPIPRPALEDQPLLITGARNSRTWFIRPQYGSGFRHWWAVEQELLKRIVHRAG